MKYKIRTQPFFSKAKEKEKLDCVAFDVCGQFSKIGHDGSRYMLVMSECFSKYVKIALLETQRATRISQKSMSVITMLRNASGKTVKSVLSDNAKEFESEIV
jgi:hypothetical protein